MLRTIASQILSIFTLSACSHAPEQAIRDHSQTKAEVLEMFDNYHRDISQKGLKGEFKYLDNTEDFFWVPPGFTSALSYDSVRGIVEQNAGMFQSVKFQWDTLQLFPLSDQIVNYTGISSGTMVDTAGNTMEISLIETGIVIKREDGWKLLSGQTANLPTKSE